MNLSCLSLTICAILSSVYVMGGEIQLIEQDLEEYTHDFVLETRRIHVPGYPHAFNPSIIRWKGRLLMSFRDQVIYPSQSLSDNSSSGSHLYFVWLDDDLNPIGSVQEIFTAPPLDEHSSCFIQDTRLIDVGDRLYIVYNGSLEVNHWISRMAIAELIEQQGLFDVVSNEWLFHFEGENSCRSEKNWVPFANLGQLLLAYEIVPHRILYPLLDGKETAESMAISFPSIVWNWGELRGGTPAKLIDEEFYLSFFHSVVYEAATVHSKGQEALHYFTGAYLFDSHWPFTIRKISPEPIIGKNFYYGEQYTPYWKPVVAVFPCGFIIENDVVLLVYGRQDHEIWVAKIDKKPLLNSLIRVSNIPVF